jgi:hypothetical protein
VKVVRRTISAGHHVGVWKQQPGWWVLDLYRVRLEFIRRAALDRHTKAEV